MILCDVHIGSIRTDPLVGRILIELLFVFEILDDRSDRLEPFALGHTLASLNNIGIELVRLGINADAFGILAVDR